MGEDSAGCTPQNEADHEQHVSHSHQRMHIHEIVDEADQTHHATDDVTSQDQDGTRSKRETHEVLTSATSVVRWWSRDCQLRFRITNLWPRYLHLHHVLWMHLRRTHGIVLDFSW